MHALSLRVRLTLWYTLTLLVALCLFGVDLSVVQRRLELRAVDRDLDALSETVANVMVSELGEHATPASAAREARQTVATRTHAVAVIDAGGRTLASSRGGLIGNPPPARTPGASFRTTRIDGRAWRVRAEGRSVGNVPVVIVVASELGGLEHESRELREALFSGIPVALLLAALGGLWLASVGLRPITDMADQATRLTSSGMEDLGQGHRRDELGQLARAFNGLIARLRGALRTQQQFMADASHELRTPASVIRAAADVSLARDHRDEPEYRETLAIVRSEALRLSRLIADMLMLARADAGGYTMRPADVYLDEIVAECARATGALAEQRGIAVRFEPAGEIPFRGDEDLLRQLVMNVVQNAVQHAPAGASVTIAARIEENAVRIRVTNTGSAIPANERERIFDRFVQLDSARGGIGAGLGLPIARWIAEAHHGSLVLESSGEQGTTFCISLPLAEAGPRVAAATA